MNGNPLCLLDFQCLGDAFLAFFPDNQQRRFFAGGLLTWFSSLLYFLLVRVLRVESVRIRQSYLICTGVYILVGLLQLNVLHYMAMASIMYLNIRLVPPKYLPLTFITTTYAYLSYRLLHFMLEENGRTQFHDSLFLMIFLARGSYLAYGLYDGSKRAKQDDAKLTEMQSANAIQHQPTLVQFLSYALYSPVLFFGPCTPYNVVQSYISMSCDEIKRRPLFLSFVLQRFSLVLFFSCVYLLFSDYAEYDWLPRADASIGYKWLCSIFIGELIKMKYYVAILLGECCAASSGISFSGFNDLKQPQHDNVLNMRIFDCMLPCSPKLLMEGWHITISNWLRYSVYERAPVVKTLAVFIASALWHGFYVGTLFGMTYGAVLVMAGRNLRRLFHHRVNHESKVAKFAYDVSSTVATVMFSHPFMLVYNADEASRVLPLLRSHLWFPTVLCLAVAVMPVQKVPAKKVPQNNHSN